MFGFSANRSATPDRLWMSPYTPDYGFQFPPDYVSGSQRRTVRSSRATSGERTHFIAVAGQSMVCSSEAEAAGDVSGTYQPTNAAKVDNFNIYDGGVYQARAPLLGCTAGINLTGQSGVGANWLCRLADKMITAGDCDRFVIGSFAVGSSKIEAWLPASSPVQFGNGSLSNRIAVFAERVKMIGIPLTGFIWSQGVSNNGNTTQASYAASLATLKSMIRDAGITCPVIINQETYYTGSTDTGVRAAQIAAVDNANGFYFGLDTDSYNSTYRQADNIHWKATGANQVATDMRLRVNACCTPYTAP